MSDLVEITQRQFYGLIYAKRLNVMPYSERDFTRWRFLNNQGIFAIETPGYLGVGAKSYRVSRDMADAANNLTPEQLAAARL